MLKVEKLSAYYGPVQILHDIDITVDAGEIVGLVGANAAGKSTLMFSLAGLRTRATGGVFIGDARVDPLPAYERVLHGLVLVPERRRLFPFMTVLENLEIGAYSAVARPVRRETLDQVYELLPVLSERRAQVAGSLSGGEQQMVAIARALISAPKLLLMDEPSLGLSPIMVQEVFKLAREINSMGIAILMVEQNARQALKVAHWAYLLETGRSVESGLAVEIGSKESVQAVFLGGHA